MSAVSTAPSQQSQNTASPDCETRNNRRDSGGSKTARREPPERIHPSSRTEVDELWCLQRTMISAEAITSIVSMTGRMLVRDIP